MNPKSDDDLFSLVKPLLLDPEVTEIMIDGYQKVYVEKRGVIQQIPSPFASQEQLLQLIDRVMWPMDLKVDESHPLLDARLPDGTRVNVVMPPVALNGPNVTMRKMTLGLLTAADLLRFGALSEAMLRFIRACVEGRLNILISGGTGSGKTTLLKVLAEMIPDDERMIILQSADEIILDKPRLVKLETRPPNIEGKGEISMQDLVKNAQRMRPDRIITIEVRGGETLDLLQAMNTGHDGCIQSLHAANPLDALSRWELMVSYANPYLPLLTVRQQIATAIDIIIHQERLSDGSRKVMSIAEVTGFEEGVVKLQDIFYVRQTGMKERKVQGFFTATGIIPDCLTQLEDAGIEIPVSLFTPDRA
jgi:pilus assembly protein CpaF